MGADRFFRIDPRWSFSRFLDEVFAYYRGTGVEGTGRRLSAIRNWLSMAGRGRAMEAIRLLEEESGGASEAAIAKSLWMSAGSYRGLKRWVSQLPSETTETKVVKAFISYKWDSGELVAWVRRLAADLRARGIEAILDQWEVRLGESFTEYMQRHIADSDVILFVVTPEAVAAAEAPKGEGGALKFEVQMMNARRIADGVRIIGVYRSGDRPPHYLRDHRYVDFRDENAYQDSLSYLVDDLLGKNAAPPVGSALPSSTPHRVAASPTPGDVTAPSMQFSRVRLESLLESNRSRDVEVVNGLWHHGRRLTPQELDGPVRIGIFDDEVFELRIPHGRLWGLAVPYGAVQRDWMTGDRKIALRLDAKPTRHEDGFHLEAD